MPTLSGTNGAHPQPSDEKPCLLISAPGLDSKTLCKDWETLACGLKAEREASALREQFIAVLGHDLRNPLSAITFGMAMISRMPQDAKAVPIMKLMGRSVDRMSALIDDIMDLARGRLGDGMSLMRTSTNLDPILTQVIDELRSQQVAGRIIAELNIVDSTNCDPGRLSQLLSNLLANALTHGSPTEPVYVRASESNGVFELSVSNSGDPIPPAALGRLFQPFTREELRPSQQGLGLGLYIAFEIARAHGGTLFAASNSVETRFTFQMPTTAGALVVIDAVNS